jgi:hypothetical protein
MKQKAGINWVNQSENLIELRQPIRKLGASYCCLPGAERRADWCPACPPDRAVRPLDQPKSKDDIQKHRWSDPQKMRQKYSCSFFSIPWICRPIGGLHGSPLSVDSVAKSYTINLSIIFTHFWSHFFCLVWPHLPVISGKIPCPVVQPLLPSVSLNGLFCFSLCLRLFCNNLFILFISSLSFFFSKIVC